MAREGKLFLPALAEELSFAALVVREDLNVVPEPAQLSPLNLICGDATVREAHRQRGSDGSSPDI